MFLSAFSPNMAKVDPYSCWDRVVNGAAGDEELENILNILDFPMEGLEGDGFVGDWDASNSQYLGPFPADVLPGPPPMHAQSKIKMGPPVLLHRQVGPIDAIPEPKQLSSQYEETSGSCIHQWSKCTEVQEQGVFQSQSPVSVLENRGSLLAGKSLLVKSHINKRSRSKRARPSGVNPLFLISPLFPTSSTIKRAYYASIFKERRKKLFHLSVSNNTIEDSSTITSDCAEQQNEASQRSAVAKKCTHCEVTKTPQWREGPLGPKTLCNACGVRFRSGRLYPEYRPAASPTFVPSLHSNSHKKVIEMRTKAKSSW